MFLDHVDKRCSENGFSGTLERILTTPLAPASIWLAA